MSTRVYSGLGQHVAFRIGGEFSPGKIEKAHLESLAASLRVAPKYLMKIASDMAEQVEAAVPAAVEQIMPRLAPPEQVMAERIQQKIAGIVKKMREPLRPDAGGRFGPGT